MAEPRDDRDAARDVARDLAEVAAMLASVTDLAIKSATYRWSWDGRKTVLENVPVTQEPP